MRIHTLFFTTIGLAACCALQAQKVCTIQGHIVKDSLRYTAAPIKKVFLNRIDEYDRTIAIDSAELKKGRFEFRYVIPTDEPIQLYGISGFDNGFPVFFVEPGEVKIEMPNGAYPNGATITGTPNNDLYTQYKELTQRSINEQSDSLKMLTSRYSKDYIDSKEGREQWLRIGAESVVRCNADRIDFLLDHNDSPLAPIMMEREIHYMLSNRYAEQLCNALSPVLKDHPYYRSFSNTVRALDLKVGHELPDITLPLIDGSKHKLSDYRGKFVLLDFWASWCGPCMREIPHLKQLYADTKAQQDKFVIISFSVDTKEKDWKKAIEAKGIQLEGWVHCSDLLGWRSPSAKFMGIEAIPQMILIDPEGKAISFSLRGEELVRRVKQILNGDLYYLNEPQVTEQK
ncbi:thioredoxin family protein [gut metagenome]|uniref:Thioredoxin family protein n=1 Tax=gut metagenome TaxID=749906 RepID=J9H4A8_9ZZZZ